MDASRVRGRCIIDCGCASMNIRFFRGTSIFMPRRVLVIREEKRWRENSGF
jgi:hypothetical protein